MVLLAKCFFHLFLPLLTLFCSSRLLRPRVLGLEQGLWVGADPIGERAFAVTVPSVEPP
jgi:hypothetical protein